MLYTGRLQEIQKVEEFQYLASACLSRPVSDISLCHASLIASACYGMLRKHTKTHQAPDCSALALRSPDTCTAHSFRCYLTLKNVYYWL